MTFKSQWQIFLLPDFIICLEYLHLYVLLLYVLKNPVYLYPGDRLQGASKEILTSITSLPDWSYCPETFPVAINFPVLHSDRKKL